MMTAFSVPISDSTKTLIAGSSVDRNIISEVYACRRNLGAFKNFHPKNYKLYKAIQNDFEAQVLRDFAEFRQRKEAA